VQPPPARSAGAQNPPRNPPAPRTDMRSPPFSRVHLHMWAVSSACRQDRCELRAGRIVSKQHMESSGSMRCGAALGQCSDTACFGTGAPGAAGSAGPHSLAVPLGPSQAADGCRSPAAPLPAGALSALLHGKASSLRTPHACHPAPRMPAMADCIAYGASGSVLA
jgi:hypothetical protein